MYLLKIKWHVRFVYVMLSKHPYINSENKSETCFGEHILLLQYVQRPVPNESYISVLFDHVASFSPGYLFYISGHLQDFSESSG